MSFNLNLKTLLTFLALFCIATAIHSQEAEREFYTHQQGCWIKRYDKKEFQLVDDSNFYKVELITQPLKRNPQFKAFKYNGEMHMAPADCLEPIDADKKKLAEEILEQDKKKLEEEKKELNTEIKPSTLDYLIEFQTGFVTTSGKSSIYPDYQTDLSPLVTHKVNDNGGGVLTIDDATGTITVNKFNNAQDSTYKTKLLTSFGIGMKRDDHFLIFRYKKFTAQKLEDPSFNVTDSGTPTRTTIAIASSFNDTITNYMLGSKFIFNEEGSFRPVFSAFLGMTSLKSTFNYVKVTTSQILPVEYQLSSISAAVDVEVGFEYFFTKNISLSTLAGYEMLFHSQLKVSDTSVTGGAPAGFKPGMKYNNGFGSMGLLLYW